MGDAVREGGVDRVLGDVALNAAVVVPPRAAAPGRLLLPAPAAPGPAATQGELKVEDRISAVAQGNDPFVDVVDMKLDKVVDMIRGKKGTTVRLQVIPSGATDASKRTMVVTVLSSGLSGGRPIRAPLSDITFSASGILFPISLIDSYPILD